MEENKEIKKTAGFYVRDTDEKKIISGVLKFVREVPERKAQMMTLLEIKQQGGGE